MENRFFNLRGIATTIAMLLLLAGCSPAKKLVQLSAGEVRDLVSEQSFKFIANRMNPMRGSQKNLNSY